MLRPESLIAFFHFKARIVKVGINACVPVPYRITKHLQKTKGFIPIKGTIEQHAFQQTLCPIRNSNHRLYVNLIMLKGAGKEIGDTVTFSVCQDDHPKTTAPPMLKAFKARLAKEQLTRSFESLTPSRQKEILKYMSFLKSPESIGRNIEKVISQLHNHQH